MPKEKWRENEEREREKEIDKKNWGSNRDKQQTNIYVLHDSMYKFEP